MPNIAPSLSQYLGPDHLLLNIIVDQSRYNEHLSKIFLKIQISSCPGAIFKNAFAKKLLGRLLIVDQKNP